MRNCSPRQGGWMNTTHDTPPPFFSGWTIPLKRLSYERDFKNVQNYA